MGCGWRGRYVGRSGELSGGDGNLRLKLAVRRATWGSFLSRAHVVCHDQLLRDWLLPHVLSIGQIVM